jgi:membrane protein DedA with SNARE-associated domain
MSAMPDVSGLLIHWGYGAIFLAVVLGNVGLPVPEESILALAGYAAQRGELRLPIVLAVGFVSAVVGDNLGYWFGRRYGRAAIERCGHWVSITPTRLEKMSSVIIRHGAWAVFAARFVTGFRFLAGPAAGAMGVPPLTFAAANVLGALLYVPYAVGLGYALGYGLGERIERLIGRIEWILLGAVGVLTLAFVAVRILRARHAAQ